MFWETLKLYVSVKKADIRPMYVFLEERDSLCYESVASENSTSKSKYFIIQRAHSLLYNPPPPSRTSFLFRFWM